MNTHLHTRSTPAHEPADLVHRGMADTSLLSLRAAAADTGTFEGYAVLWDTTDSYGTSFAPRSFSAGGLDDDLYALLDMHNPTQVIGTFSAVEDDRGMLIKGQWDDSTSGRDARARAKSGSAPGLSVGFQALMLDPDDEMRFTQCRLIEVSQITARMAAVPGAAFSAVRKQTTPTPADLERDRKAQAVRAMLDLARPL